MSSSHLDSAVSILRKLPDELDRVLKELVQQEHYIKSEPSFIIQATDYIQHCRYILEYIASHIATLLPKPPKQTKFIVVHPPETQADFLKMFRKAFPGLDTSHPDILNLMEEHQYYNSSDWISGLVKVSNETKHAKLSYCTRGNCKSVIVYFRDKPILQVGDRGLRGLHIEGGGTGGIAVRINGKPTVVIRGPQTIDADTRYLKDAHPAISVQKNTWQELKFDLAPQIPAKQLFTSSYINTIRIFVRLCRILGIPVPADIQENHDNPPLSFPSMVDEIASDDQLRST